MTPSFFILMFAMSEGTILYNVIPLHWKGLRETIGEDGDEIVIVKRRVAGGCCVRFAWRCLPFYSYFIVNVPANIIAGFSLYIYQL